MAIVSLKNIRLTFGGSPLMDGIDLTVEAGERLCLLGRNGSGKSTLLRLVAGTISPDSGEVARRQGLTVGLVDQSVPEGMSGSALSVVAAGPETEDGVAAARILTRLGMDPEAQVSTLSGGGRRRVLLAKALASGPDLLLFDEPTNHLDIETIEWLEEHLLKQGASIIFVTHDRNFARKIATRVAEIDRGMLMAFSCGYDEFVERREELYAAEDRARALFDKRLAKEEEWIRRGVKARTTRNEGRVKALEKMRVEYGERRDRMGVARVTVQQTERSGDLVIEAKNLSFGYLRDGPQIVKNLDTTIMRGDKLGIVGPNGSGKTTLVRLLCGDLVPVEGVVKRGTELRIAYLDQMRAALNPTASVIENLGEGYDTLTINGKPKHILAYLQDFLFSPDRARQPVAVLSGGERNRLLLAKLFSRPSNLLVMDEPTNDLDLETLEVLEDMVLDYPGTVIIVSHDRAFIDNVVGSCLVFTGNGRVTEYVGGYGDWREREKRRIAAENGSTPRQASKAAPDTGARINKVRKLSFKEEKELAGLPARIEGLEAEQSQIHAGLSDPALYASGPAAAADLAARLSVVDDELQAAYARWEELENVGP